MYSPREAQKDFLYTKLAIFLLSLLVSGGIAVWGLKQAVEYGLISLSPGQSQGRVVRIEERDRTVRVTFEYDDDELVRHSGTLNQRRRFALRLNTGDDVPVVYFSVYPAIAQLEAQLSRQAISFYILVGCFCFHVAACTAIVRTVIRIRRHAAEDVYY